MSNYLVPAMTDIELTKRCAEKMGYESIEISSWSDGPILRVRGDNYSGSADDGWFGYDPLHDDAQAMALLKRFNLVIEREKGDELFGVTLFPARANGKHSKTIVVRAAKDLNRAIVECVARTP